MRGPGIEDPCNSLRHTGVISAHFGGLACHSSEELAVSRFTEPWHEIRHVSSGLLLGADVTIQHRSLFVTVSDNDGIQPDWDD